MNTITNANLFSRLFDGLDDPNRLAIETLDGEHISYGDLIARAGQMANVLVERGVKPGDRVAAQTEKSVPGLVLYLATVRAGAVYLPLNTAYTLNELEYFITDAEPSLVVCDPVQGGRHRRDRGQGRRQGRDAGRRRQGLADRRRRQGAAGIRDRRPRQRRSRRDPLHLGHHRPFQGRDADARQSGVEFAHRWSTTGASPTRTC